MNVEQMHMAISEEHQAARQGGDAEAMTESTLKFLRLYEEFPQHPQILFSAATCFMNMGYNALARVVFSALIDSGSQEVPEFWNNLGVACRNMHLLDEALNAFIKSIDLNPFESNYYSNFSTLFINEGESQAGEVLSQEAIKLSPTNYRALWNYSLLLLEEGRLSEGFELYDAGLLSGDRIIRTYYKDNPLPAWTGEPDQNVIFYDEQGIGDRILFANALRLAIPRCRRAIIDCHPRLYGLYERSFRHLTPHIYPTSKDEAPEWVSAHPDFEYRIATGSLPRYFWKDPESIDTTAYLKADPEKVATVKEALKDYPKPWIGFAWSGGTVKTHAKARTFKIGHLYHFMEVNSQGTWVSLEYPPGSGDQVRKSAQEKGLAMVHFDDWVHDFDYDWNAAIAHNMDLVITPCTSLVHLCGALGVPCWVMVPRKRAWRYAATDSMSWYSTVKQYHQEVHGQWGGVLGRIKIDLMRWMLIGGYL